MTAMQEERAWGPLSDLPGHPMMWVLILTETVTFGMLFVTFAVAGAVNLPVFVAGEAQLAPAAGGLNTLVLVTSGWLAALAVEARAGNRRGKARALLMGSIFLGCVFVAVKIAEYGAKVEAGIGLETDTFFTLYFLLTGFHLLHVVLGIVILAAVALHDSLDNLETGTTFWHMVDLVWIVMYPLVYLIW
jgi:nitric oxide reductase NorE protein